MAKPSIIVYGPQGCGKTRNGAALAKAYGFDRVVELEDWPFRGKPPREGALLLSCRELASLAEYNLQLVSYATAAKKAGL